MLDKAQSLADELVRLRRDIHQHPELGFQEFRTAALVADTLAEIGIEAQTGVGRTGVVGQIGSGDGPTIAIRADMDALAGIDAVIALHVWSDKTSGKVWLHDGFSLAAVDQFDAWIYGDGAHGAYPHTGSDPLFMLGPILNAFYAIPSRQINPLRPSVISLGQIRGGTAHNIIPKEVFLQGTIRSHDKAVREQLWAEIDRALSLSKPLGGDYKLEIMKGYPALLNDARVNGWLKDVVVDLVGETAVVEEEFGMGAEDFAYMTQKAPGAMFMLGAAIPDSPERHHHNRYLRH